MVLLAPSGSSWETVRYILLSGCRVLSVSRRSLLLPTGRLSTPTIVRSPSHELQLEPTETACACPARTCGAVTMRATRIASAHAGLIAIGSVLLGSALYCTAAGPRAI